VELGEAATEAPVEEGAGLHPGDGLADHADGSHAAGGVVEVGELDGDLRVDALEGVLFCVLGLD